MPMASCTYLFGVPATDTTPGVHANTALPASQTHAYAEADALRGLCTERPLILLRPYNLLTIDLLTLQVPGMKPPCEHSILDGA